MPRYNVDLNLKGVHCSQGRMEKLCTCICNIKDRGAIQKVDGLDSGALSERNLGVRGHSPWSNSSCSYAFKFWLIDSVDL